MINEETLKLVDIPKIKYENIKVRDFNKIDFNQSDLKNLKLDYTTGDELTIAIEELKDGLILTPKNKKTGANNI